MRRYLHGLLGCVILVGLCTLGFGLNSTAMFYWPAWEPYPAESPTVESWLHCPVGDEACVQDRHDARQRAKTTPPPDATP